MDSLLSRMIRAAKLEVDLYEEVEADTTATSQAITVVILVAIANGIGAAISFFVFGRGIGGLFRGLFLGPILSMIGYFIWAFLTYFIGVNVFGGTADYGEMLRTIGFAYTPNILGIFAFIPCLGGLISFVGAIWALVAGVIAVRQALDFDTAKAIMTCIIGWIVSLILTVVFGTFWRLGTLGVRRLFRPPLRY